ncbi:hypothetical protein KZC51_05815 [Microbacterium sp. SSW1-49]|uniref:Integral membrane protein n=1 Tax=Microbacterium croceum TaxID=2851645 RepID=A0ABT0FC71_9MICO|nr:hypothetical protein [Microbacterium croceum]MCK2035649.1 hypothetical protein [Microbacterium croceum]
MASTTEELQQRLQALEAENATLRAALPSDTPVERRSRRTWGRTLLATALITLGALLAPVAVVATWANVQLTDTERFVASYAPLADDPAIQSLITTQVIAVIDEQVDIPTLTSDVIDGIIDLGTGDRATRALELLKGPAAQGLQSLVASVVARFVESEAFANVWASALRVSHAQLTGALQNDPTVALDLGAEGTIGIQLAPIIDAVKDALVDRGVGFAAAIPTVDRTIVVATSDALPTVQLAYGLAVSAGVWLPWISLLLLAAGVIAAHRRWTAGITAALALAGSMVILLAGFAIGRLFFDAAMRSGPVSPDAGGVMFETFTGAMRDTAIAVLVLSLVVAVVVWFCGPFAVPTRLRAATNAGTARLRAGWERHGVTTGRVGRWLYAQRTLLRVVVAVIGAAVVLLVRPLTPSLVIWTLALATLGVLLFELAEQPPAEVDATAEEAGEVPVSAAAAGRES